GSIEPRYTVALGFQVFGRLISRDVNVGDLVTKGETLATIDPAVQEIAVRSAQASLDSAQAQLSTVQATEERQRTLLEQRVIAQAGFDLTELGGRDATTISVTGGLVAGERVVTAGVHSLSPGQTVKILEASQ